VWIASLRAAMVAVGFKKMENRTSQQEGIIIISENGDPTYLVRKNGAVKYYKLSEMGFGDHVEMLGADKPQI
jgi:hypothetical protein